MSSQTVAILGVGMHPWGKWGRSFLEYASVAARAAVIDADLHWSEIDCVVAAGTVRSGYAGHVAASIIADMLGLAGTEALTVYAACASGAHALAVARDRLLAGCCNTVLVVAADLAAPPPDTEIVIPADPKHGIASTQMFAPPVYLALRAARRMHERGTTVQDLHAVRIKNSHHGVFNENARFRRELTSEEIERSPIVASPLRLLHIASYSDGAAAVIVGNVDHPRRNRNCALIQAVSLSHQLDGIVSPALSAQTSALEQPRSRRANLEKVFAQSGVSPADLSAIELYDVSPVAELDWYETIGLCTTGDAEKLLQSGETRLGGRIPVNASGGLASFGEAVSAQGLAQIYELSRQLQGRCLGRQIENARIGLAVCDGMYGQTASVLLTNSN